MNDLMLELTGLRRERASLINLLDERKDKIEQLRSLLREVEWQNYGEAYYQPFCPICHGLPETGHATDCRLAAALED